MEKEDKRIEAIVNKLMQADSVEKAPLDFTDNVMAKVDVLSKSSVTTYKPLIPKVVLYAIAASFIALVVYILFKSPADNTSLSERYNLPELSLNPLEGLSFDFSSTLMYATVLFAIMISIQIPLLKQYFNNRLSY
ncbi:hypothetical protein [uncultured Winogradskyella sp.]|uniref:hypothetical protein n=1 Tax=uncultured Winogradskyella sp. TaxID=395353 RepID=UPI002602D73A|nr:hypothetical protein [uncultured Winogradskyella sp.]